MPTTHRSARPTDRKRPTYRPEAADLATFDDRYTLRYVRLLPQPVERVWEAVTRPEQLNVWLMPVTEIEPRLGGRCRFSWGSPRDAANDGTVLVFDPPHRVRYGNEDAAIEFQLEPNPTAEGFPGTRFTFLQRFSPKFRHDDGLDDRPGGSLPAGADTPWRPGFVAGFHLAFDELGRFLGRAWSPERIATESARVVDIANTPHGKQHFESDPDTSDWHDLVVLYEEIIRSQCPSA